MSQYRWHFILEFRKRTEASEQSSDEVDEGTEDESTSESDIVVDERGKNTARYTDIQGYGSEEIDGIERLVEIAGSHVGHGGVAHPQRVGGEVEQRHGGQHEPSPRVARVLTRARYREELNNCIDREALKTENI